MANAIYPTAKDKWMNPGTLGVSSGTSIDLIDDTIKIALIDTGIYTYSAAHEFLISANAAIVGNAQTLNTKTVASGVFDAADVTFPLVSGASIEALIIYKDTGAPVTSPLILYIDVVASGLPLTPSGGNVTATFNASGIFAL
jgi:hypothetical protein